MKKLKQKCELIGRLLLVLVTLFTNFVGIMPVLASESYNKGDVINPINSKGSIETDGSAKITKTVSKTEEEGIYQIDLSVQGKDKVTNESTTAPIYVAVVLDTSGSMEYEVCVKYEWKWFGFIPYRKCVEKKDIKYGEAKKAANSFANKLLTKYSTSQLALVTFASDVQTTRDFASKNFDDVSYPSAYGATNLGGAIKRADELLSAKKSEVSDAKLYMVILSDGYPEGTQSADYNVAAKNAKDVTGVEIFSIGYDTDDDTEELLKKIATDEDHYFNADGSTVVDKMTNIVNQMEVRVPAGTDAVLKDVIGDEFTYVEGSKTSDDIVIDGKNVTVNVRKITEEEKKYSFLVKINKDANDGLHNTNSSCKLEFKNISGNNDSLILDDSAKVYWEANKYYYTINYYKGYVSQSNFINKVDGSAVLNTEIKLTDIDVNKYKPITGYKDGKVKTNLPYKIKDGNNVINVVYEVKDDLSYTVEYYKDENKISNDSDNTFGNKYFGEKITEDQILKNKYLTFGYQNGYIKTVMPYTIIDGRNIIKVCYEKRNDMSYTVKYLEKDTNNNIGIIDKKVDGRTYNETYTEKAATAPYGYKLASKNEKTIKVDSDNKTLIFYYEKEKANYEVKYIDKDTNKEIAPAKNKEAYLIEPIVENAIEIKGYNLVSEDKIEIRLTKDEVNEIVFYYEKSVVNYKVRYLDNTTHEEIRPSVTKEGLYLDKVVEKALDIEGYKLSSLNEVSIQLDVENNEIVFYYDKVVEVVKTGVVDNNNNYIVFIGLLSSLAVLGYSLKKRFN